MSKLQVNVRQVPEPPKFFLESTKLYEEADDKRDYYEETSGFSVEILHHGMTYYVVWKDD
jgi:hypothetical protein